MYPSRFRALTVWLLVVAAAATTAEGQPLTEDSFSMETACTQEVLDLHQFFQDWFLGTLPNTDAAFARFTDVMDSDFHIAPPSGQIAALDALQLRLRNAHGSWISKKEDPSRIWIENPRVRVLSDEHALVTYEEWQHHDGQTRGRLSTAIMKRDRGTPNGVRWLHVHETWLPESSPAP